MNGAQLVSPITRGSLDRNGTRAVISRDTERAARQVFDLIVLGGGVHGIALTLEAARRGFSVLLCEQSDFGAKTSWNSSRIVHGGFRYLQHLDLVRFRESVVERRWFLRHFPDLVSPLPCLLPLYEKGIRRRSVLRCALAINDLLSPDRSTGVKADRRIPGGKILSRAETMETFPAVQRDRLKGAAVWHDATVPDSQVLLIEMLLWAIACGAWALNYTEAKELIETAGKVRGVVVWDRAENKAFEYRAPVVVNTTGPWCREIASRFDRDVPGLYSFSLAVNVLIDRPPLSSSALAVEPFAGSSSTYFVVPWKERILAGTLHLDSADVRRDDPVEDAAIRRLLADVNRAVPGLDLGSSDVLRVLWGYVPAKSVGGVDQADRATIHNHGDGGGVKGLFSVNGVKFTTARAVGEETLRRIQEWRGLRLPSLTAVERPPRRRRATAGEFENLLVSNTSQAIDHARELIDTGGTQVR